MLRILDQIGPAAADSTCGVPFSRREWLRIGGIGLGGVSLPLLSRARLSATPTGAGLAFGQAKSCIIFGLVGGPPQHETWDPKPDAPVEVRGPLGSIESSVPGLRVGELMPRTAQLAHKIAVLRAMSTNDNAHSSSGYYMLTGQPHIPMNVESVFPKAPNDWPSFAALIKHLHRGRPGLPPSVVLPEHIWNDGNIPWPGQDGGFLGRTADPWLLTCDPDAASFRPPALSLSAEVPALRFDHRRKLLEQINEHLHAQARTVEQYDVDSRQAFDLLASPDVRRAFELEREPPAVRDGYTRTRWGQSVLLARRLVEAGVKLVQINWTRIKDQPNQGGWDTHAKNAEALQTFLMPMMDQSFSSLLHDLDERGLLDETLVVWFGEFGRTPRFNAAAGRDHWGPVFSLALAGGGIRGGVVYGASDHLGAQPLEGRVQPPDLLATLFHCLGISPESEYADGQGRPLPLSRGQVIEQLF